MLLQHARLDERPRRSISHGRAAERVDELLDGAAADRVVAIRPVDGDDRDRPVGLVPDVLGVLAEGCSSLAVAATPSGGGLPSAVCTTVSVYDPSVKS